MTRAMAVLGYFLKIATIAIDVRYRPQRFAEVSLTVNVLSLVDVQAANGKLSVGGLSSAITAGKVVDDESGNLVARNVLDAILNNLVDLGTGVAIKIIRRLAQWNFKAYLHPQEGTNVGNLSGSRSQSWVAHSRGSGDDLG